MPTPRINMRKLKDGYTTTAEHLPLAHQAHAQWTPERLIASSPGASVSAWPVLGW